MLSGLFIMEYKLLLLVTLPGTLLDSTETDKGNENAVFVGSDVQISLSRSATIRGTKLSSVLTSVQPHWVISNHI
jgi:hypothetical protein